MNLRYCFKLFICSIFLLSCHNVIADKVSDSPTVQKEQKKKFDKEISQAIKDKQLGTFTALYDSAPNTLPPYNLASYIIHRGTLDMLQYLIDKGMDIQLRDKDGYTLLHEAAYYDRPEFASYLIAGGLDTNAKAKDGTDLVNMCANSSEDMLNMLVGHGLKIDKEKNSDIVSTALNDYNPKMAQYFLQQGYQFDPAILQDKDFLFELLRHESIQTLDFLLARGLNIESKVSIYGSDNSLLQFAAVINSKDMVNALLKRGANPDAFNSRGEGVLEQSIKQNQTEISLLLIKGGTNPSTMTEPPFEKSVLQIAIQYGQNDIALALIHAGADIHVRDGMYKRNALHHAAFLGNVDILKALVEHGGKVHDLDQQRKAPLDIARIEQHQGAISYLEKIEAEQPGLRE